MAISSTPLPAATGPSGRSVGAVGSRASGASGCVGFAELMAALLPDATSTDAPNTGVVPGPPGAVAAPDANLLDVQAGVPAEASGEVSSEPVGAIGLPGPMDEPTDESGGESGGEPEAAPEVSAAIASVAAAAALPTLVPASLLPRATVTASSASATTTGPDPSPAAAAGPSSGAEAAPGLTEAPKLAMFPGAPAPSSTPESTPTPATTAPAPAPESQATPAPEPSAAPAAPATPSPSAAISAVSPSHAAPDVAAAAVSPLAQVDATTTPTPTGATRQVAAELLRLAESGPRHDTTRHVTLQLNPAALGEVRVTLSMRAGAVRVRLSAESGVTREALANGVPELRRLLADHTQAAAHTGRLGHLDRGEVTVTVASLLHDPAAGSAEPRSAESSLADGTGSQHHHDDRHPSEGAGHDGQRPARTPLGHTATDGARPAAALPPVDDQPSSSPPGRLDVSV